MEPTSLSELLDLLEVKALGCLNQKTLGCPNEKVLACPNENALGCPNEKTLAFLLNEQYLYFNNHITQDVTIPVHFQPLDFMMEMEV